MTAYMTEIAVADWAASVAWYRDVLGLQVAVSDPVHGFALLRGGDGGRLAVKAGTPVPGGVTMHYVVADLDAELHRIGGTFDVKRSSEGYRRSILYDPDGYSVVLFEWTAVPPSLL